MNEAAGGATSEVMPTVLRQKEIFESVLHYMGDAVIVADWEEKW